MSEELRKWLKQVEEQLVEADEMGRQFAKNARVEARWRRAAWAYSHGHTIVSKVRDLVEALDELEAAYQDQTDKRDRRIDKAWTLAESALRAPGGGKR